MSDNFLDDWLSKPKKNKPPKVGDMVVYKSEESDFNCGHVLKLGDSEVLVGYRGDQGCPKTISVKIENLIKTNNEEELIGRYP